MSKIETHFSCKVIVNICHRIHFKKYILCKCTAFLYIIDTFDHLQNDCNNNINAILRYKPMKVLSLPALNG